MKQITDSGNCFGCSLCHDACSFGAITMSMDRGFYRPVIDEDLCKDCGKCEKLCPANSLDELTTQKHEPKECYAAWSLDDALHFNCASGGLTTEIAKAFIKNGGFVVGCRLNKESLLAEHYIIESENDLPEMAKSKYVHSDKTGLYKKASELLKSKKCLFIGVSCEVMAFLKFLKTVTAVTQQVYTINLLCRGGASPTLYAMHRLDIQRKVGSIDNITFRGGEQDCRFTCYKNGKIVYQKGQFEDEYFLQFMKHSLYQPVCYSCPGAGTERFGDLTLADFWGLDNDCLKKANGKGTNLVLVHSEKGRELFESVKDKIEFYERPLSEAVAGNETLQCPTPKPSEYDWFWNEFSKGNYSKTIRKLYKDDYKKLRKQKIICLFIRAAKKIIPSGLYRKIKSKIKGEPKMSKITGYTTGVFDMFHIGHLNILKNAKSQCDYLVVGVSTDELVESYKKHKPVIPFKDRMEIVRAIKYVDEVVPQTTMDKYEAWKQIKFQRIFHGNDWKNSELYNEMEKKLSAVGVEMIYFPYTQGVSSSGLYASIRNGGGGGG